MNAANRNLLVRVISALVLAPPLVLLILWERPEGVALIINFAVGLALGELYWITLRDDPLWMRALGLLGGVGLSAVIVWISRPGAVLATLVLLTLLITVVQLFWHRDVTRATTQAAQYVFGLLYVAVLLSCLALLKRQPRGAEWVILVLTITWFSDTGAYAAGRALGRHKLYPAISPGKTIEGAVGGLLAAFAAAALAKLWYLPQLSWLGALLLAIPGGALGQLGDLVESMIKRGYGVKDSGKAIPGHGGLLDRIDALLFVAPYVYLCHWLGLVTP